MSGKKCKKHSFLKKGVDFLNPAYDIIQKLINGPLVKHKTSPSHGENGSSDSPTGHQPGSRAAENRGGRLSKFVSYRPMGDWF